ncbi:MAG TPA: cytochrome c oxidase subunit I [Longimicrobium sp.]|nr:cytochrome c oxidase subunit I [Longimicrobium sp.]
MSTIEAGPGVEERLRTNWEPPETLYFQLASVDHKKIGKRYLITAFLFLLVGGVEALLMRMQLSRPENTLLTPEQYDQLFTMHGVTMIFWYAAPILSGFGNYLVPLFIGSRDMAFPRLNAFSYWTFLLSGIVLYTGALIGMAPDGGWFAYTPLTGPAFSPGLNLDFYAISLLFLTISTTAGAINFIVTIFKMRCPGMSMSRMPLALWSTLTMSFAVVFGMPPLTAALVFLELERRWNFHFFDPLSGSPLLWQHLFWIFGHPWVYIVILPATGLVSMMLPTFCRRPIVGHTYIVLATIATGMAGFGVWVHHMFATGIPVLSTTFFSAASLTVSIPSGIQIFGWLATIWHAKRHVWRTPFYFIVGFIVLFVIGGFSGVMTAAIPADWQETDTYFVVAHIHYVLIGINLFPVMAAFYYWLPKMTGRMLDERLGRWNFWVMFTGMNIAFFPMHVVGMLGMTRRIYTYPAHLGWTWLNQVETVGGFIFAAGVLIFVANYFISRKNGVRAGPNPWQASSLEWSVSSPPPAWNFSVIPAVASREPLWDGTDLLAGGGGDGRVLSHEKKTLGTTVLDAVPDSVLHMPEDTLYPLGLSVALTVLFYGLVFKSVPVFAVGLLATFAAIVGWLWPKPGELPE